MGAIYQRIKETLAAVLPTYDPGAHIGEVKTPYAVVHDMGVNAQAGTKGMLGQRIYEIVILVPDGEQEQLEPLCKQAKNALKALRTRLKETGESGPSALEVQYRGASRSLIYRMPVRTG